MRLPRRVSWASLAELDEVCSWIYADETDTNARLRALNRLTAWKAITQLPHALESVLSLVSATILDETYIMKTRCLQCTGDGWREFAVSENNSALNVRQSYAAAIVRLVNGLVDPLQLGSFARPIASIAAQIRLPQWLVELRHGATHEDLPSLELLRTGARESLAWLLQNYFLPVLSSANAEQSTSVAPLPPLHPLLKCYKTTMKAITRDSSVKMQRKDELTKCIRDIERWICEVRVVWPNVIVNSWNSDYSGEEGHGSGRWALGQLCDALTDKGGLVPVSTRKRLASSLKSDPVLPAKLLALWTPLLLSLSANHPILPAVLVSSITDFLLYRPSTKEAKSTKDLSHDLCLAAWAAWCVDNWESSSDVQEGSNVLKREKIVIGIVSALAIRADESSITRPGANALLRLLVRSDRSLEEASSTLLSAPVASQDSWTDGALYLMEERLKKLLDLDAQPGLEEMDVSSIGMDVERNPSLDSPIVATAQSDEMPKGWRSVQADSWRPLPIGVFRESS